jgi:hypothetical protein
MDHDDLEARYYVALGAAFVRGRMPAIAARGAATEPVPTDASVFAAGLAGGLELHKFKRNAELPRVRRVLSMLAALGPTLVVDSGTHWLARPIVPNGLADAP